MELQFSRVTVLWWLYFSLFDESHTETQRYFIDITNCGERTDSECAEYFKFIAGKYCQIARHPLCSQYSLKDYDCAYGQHSCPSITTCTTIAGGYECNCGTGYEYDGSNCTDINECDTGEHRCSRQKRCTNIQGGYKCCIDTNCNNEEVID
ncbi:uncharacterized protein LOC120326857 [Styela clava]